MSWLGQRAVDAARPVDFARTRFCLADIVGTGRPVLMASVSTEGQMANWKDELKESLKTPEEKAGEQARREAEAIAAAQSVVATGLARIKQMFFEAQAMLTGRTAAQPVVNFDSMNDSSLTHGDRILSAKASADRTRLVIAFDGQEVTLIYNRLKAALVLEDRQQADFDLDTYIGQKILSLSKLPRQG